MWVRTVLQHMFRSKDGNQDSGTQAEGETVDARKATCIIKAMNGEGDIGLYMVESSRIVAPRIPTTMEKKRGDQGEKNGMCSDGIEQRGGKVQAAGWYGREDCSDGDEAQLCELFVLKLEPCPCSRHILWETNHGKRVRPSSSLSSDWVNKERGSQSEGERVEEGGGAEDGREGRRFEGIDRDPEEAIEGAREREDVGLGTFSSPMLSSLSAVVPSTLQDVKRWWTSMPAAVRPSNIFGMSDRQSKILQNWQIQQQEELRQLTAEAQEGGGQEHGEETTDSVEGGARLLAQDWTQEAEADVFPPSVD